MSTENGKIILIDKPTGITSFDVIRILRRKLGIRKMGHAGTLDPMATGLMIIGIGDGTKRLKNLIGLPKTYEAEILFGVQTNTGDIEGKIIAQKPVPDLKKEDIKKTLKGMIGELELVVPVFSAIKKAGKPLYKYARAGEKIEPPIKKMKIIKARLTGMKGNTIKTNLEVSSGTYIRSIAEELGHRLDTIATLKKLRRTKIGEYSISNAVKLEENKIDQPDWTGLNIDSR